MKVKQYDKDNPKSELIDKLIGEMIGVQDLPFHFVEGIDFRRLMQSIVSKYSLREPSFSQTTYATINKNNNKGISVHDFYVGHLDRPQCQCFFAKFN